jgi:hypothetical protein
LGALDAFGTLLGIPPGTLELAGLGLTVTGQLNDIVNSIADLDHYSYGLCGGMAYASADYFHWGLIPPRGFPGQPDVQPSRATPQGETLRNYLWQRLIDSFIGGGVAVRCLEWMAILHLIPEDIGGGASEVCSRTKGEWGKLKQHIDAGQPWPITLIGTTTNPSHNHQVLVYGYKDAGPAQCGMFYYDNNHPGYEAATFLDFTHDELRASEVFRSDHRGPLKGFFCDDYQPARPPVAVGLVEGISASRARASVADAIEFDYAVQNLGYGIAPPIRLWVRRVLPPQPLAPHTPIVHPPVVHRPGGPGHPPIGVIDPGDPGPGGGDDGGSAADGGPTVTDAIMEYFTAPGVPSGTATTLNGPVTTTNTAGAPSDPVALSAESIGLPAPGPWQFSGAAEVVWRYGPRMVSAMRNLPTLVPGTTPMEVVLVSAPAHRAAPAKAGPVASPIQQSVSVREVAASLDEPTVQEGSTAHEDVVAKRRGRAVPKTSTTDG